MGEYVQKKSQTVRDFQDPEFEMEFQRMNTQKAFNEFMARPMRSTPEEMHEELMQPLHMKNFSRKDRARRKYIVHKRREYKVRYSLKE